MKKPVYVRCPRCELNYIEKKEKLCSVCKAELSARKEEYTSDLDLELCPICKTNYITADEIMCATCLKEHQTEDGELSADWEEYLNRDEDETTDDYDDSGDGDIATVTDLDHADTLDDEIDSEIGFDDSIDDELDEELDGLDFDDEDEEEDDDDFDEDDDDEVPEDDDDDF